MTRKITLLAIVPVLALGLTACGSSGTDAGSAPTSSSMSSMNMPPSSSSDSGSSPSSSSSESKDAEAVITISDFAYKVPASVAPGTTITIKNGDSQAHTVTSKEGGFDVKIDPNGTATMKAPDKPGSYKFVCTFHANMSSTLVVK
ncbi:cupredoxin domain-containing protein [Pedococcus bigeumensis]|uniref:cupredoxin domain-containing protein n=1 Tax=Pedococcus bigeumensis TaxID=433644 RepID=UPI002FED17FC